MLNTKLSGESADPAAFTVSGVVSNPEVTEVVVSESSIHLTLSANIAYTDTNIKVNYAKTGTNNLTVFGTATELDDFSNMPIQNNSLRVAYNGNGNTEGTVPTDTTGYYNGDNVATKRLSSSENCCKLKKRAQNPVTQRTRPFWPQA